MHVYLFHVTWTRRVDDTPTREVTRVLSIICSHVILFIWLIFLLSFVLHCGNRHTQLDIWLVRDMSHTRSGVQQLSKTTVGLWESSETHIRFTLIFMSIFASGGGRGFDQICGSWYLHNKWDIRCYVWDRLVDKHDLASGALVYT